MKGRVVIVTGAAKGIGHACAIAFGKAGATVVVSDRNADQAEVVASMIVAAGGSASHDPCDVTDEAAVAALVDGAVARHGRLDFAINNAGTAPTPSPVTHISTAEWNDIIATNLTGLFYCLRAQVAAIQASGRGGAIVTIASTTGLRGASGLAGYSASKHGAIGLTRSAALEAASANIRINSICPGAIETPLFEARMHQTSARDTIVKRIPLGRVGQPEEIAGLAVWLCSDAASFVTGAEYTVDGGMIAR